MSSSSSSSHVTVTYTSVSSDDNLPSWGIPLMEYLAPSDDDIAPAEDQPLPASPIALSPGYIVDSEPIKDESEEDPEMAPIDYAADEEEEHLALADSALFVPNSVPSAEETEPFKTDEFAATPPPPRSPQIVVPLSQIGLYRAWKTARPQIPLSSFIETQIVEYVSAPTPPLPPPSPLTPLSSPLPLIPSPPLPLPSPDRRGAILEADMLPQKRICFTAPSHRFKIGKSLAAAIARQTRPALARGVDYGFIDTLDASIRAINERVVTALEGVNERITNLTATHRHDKASYARQAWAYYEDRSQAMKAQIKAL
ncbi:hypothetical protein Tco_0168262 [Tanacetum coccineum]